jgi:hypothetical protein
VKRLSALAFFFCLSCVRTLPFPDPHLEGEYGRALKKWTRQVALYSGLETRAFVRVVYLSPDFVVSQARELSQLRAEQPDKAAQTLARLRHEYEKPSFFAVVYIPDKTANDWNETGSVWRLALNEGTGEVAPETVIRHELPFNAELRTLYPYLDDYSVAYEIRFPQPPPPPANAQPAVGVVGRMLPPLPAEAQLIAAGALGKMVFHWRLDGGPEAPPTAEPTPPQGPAPTPKPP